MPRETRPDDSSIAEGFGQPGKRTQVRSVNQLPPLEVVLEVRGTKLFLPISALLLNVDIPGLSEY